MAMSGSTSSDNGMSARFEFSVKQGTTSCALSVWIPNDSSIASNGGDPSVYSVFNGFSVNNSNLGSVHVVQHDNLNRWVSLGSHVTNTGRLMVELHAAGIDYGSGRNHAHHSVTEVRAVCGSA
jgi:hypothetical protein